MAAESRRSHPPNPRGVTFTVAPAPGLTQEERLARRVRALEVLLSSGAPQNAEGRVAGAPTTRPRQAGETRGGNHTGDPTPILRH